MLELLEVLDLEYVEILVRMGSFKKWATLLSTNFTTQYHLNACFVVKRE